MDKTLFIVDDHTMVRNGLTSWLEKNTDWKILKEFSSGTECLNYLEVISQLEYKSELIPQIIIIDVQLLNETGFSLLKQISTKYPNIKTVMFSMYDTAGFVLRAKDDGAQGYVSKVAPESELLNCLEAVSKGEFYLEKRMEESQLKLQNVISVLTKQEKNIFEAILQGKSNEEISDELFLSLRTVENYTSRLYQKIDISGREELIQKYSN